MISTSTVIAREAKQSPSRKVEIALARKPSLAMTQRIALASIAVLAAVVLITYQPALRLDFYGDDYSFLETAGRSSLAQYLAFYFDPRLQTGWYRPMQGMVFGIGWVLFGGNPTGYHIVNLLVHLANCLLLFALVGVVSKKWRVAFLSALIYSGLPLYGVAVFWPGDADFLLTFFYLSSILCWVLYLQQAGKRRFFILAFIFFLLALTTKEFSVTLPAMLFLVDRLLLRDRIPFPAFVRRYLPFLIVYLFYLPLEYYIQSRSVLTNTYGYGIATHVVFNFVQYLASLTFPWGLPEPLDYIWLVIAILLFGFLAPKKKSAPLLFLGIAAILAFLPVTPFPWFFTRYLYLAVMASAIAIVSLVELVATRFAHSRWLAPSASAAIALVVLGNSIGSASATADFAELSRQTRVPFRDITQRHSTFPDDTYLYFINPPTITSQLSGMFFLRYGGGVHVASDESGNRRANLREHANAYVIYFDEQRRTREVPVEMQLSIETRPFLPINFAAPVRLEDFEMASANVKRDQAIVLLLYWRGLKPIESDYNVAVHLLDSSGKVIAQSDQAPRRGQTSTSAWAPGVLVVDAIQAPIAHDIPLGAYRLEIALHEATTRARVAIVDARGSVIADRVVIDGVRVVE